MTICCADIPHLPGLESIIFRAGLRGGQRIVRWPYVAENDSIEPWVSGGELVFVTGINHQRNEENLCQLVREAVNKHVAGMVILTGPQFIQRIPKRVLELANEHHFPLLEQPYELKMVLVTEVISNAIVQDNLLGKSVKLFLTKLINGQAQAPELIHLRASELGMSDSRPFALLSISTKPTTDLWAQADGQTGSVQSTLNESSASHPLSAPIVQQPLLQYLADILKRRGVEWPILDYQQDMLAIWPLEEVNSVDLQAELEQVVNLLQQRFSHLSFYIGVSEFKQGLEQLAEATEQARQALHFAVSNQPKKIFFYDQLGIAKLFSAIPQRALLVQFCQQYLGELCFTDDTTAVAMKQTLHYYFNHFGHQQHTADAMGIHRNTLTYRLSKIEQRLGYSLQDPLLRFNLQNALLIEQMLFHDGLQSSNETGNR